MFIYIHADGPLMHKLIDTPVDGVVLGVRPFALRMRETYTPDALEPLVMKAANHGKSVFLNMNALVHEGDLSALDHVFGKIRDLPVDGILFADLAVASKAGEHGLKHLLIYDAETYLTNHEDIMFWKEEGIKAVVGARQLTIDDIDSISEKSVLPFALLGHGHINMFHSARPLVESFLKHEGKKDAGSYNKTPLHIVEAQREDEPYPIYQDDFGTHVFRSKPMHSFNVMDRLKKALTYFFVDSLFYQEDRVVSIACDLVKARDKGTDDVLLKRYVDHDEGFLHKKTVYRQGTVK